VTHAATPDDDDRAERVYSCLDADRRADGIEAARNAIGRGRLVVMPTDTVYGLAADAFDPAGVRRLLRAKGRTRRVPTPVLIAAPETLRALATSVPPAARELSRAFWPGGLTLICRQQPTLQWDLGDTRGTVAIRMPDHPDALELLAETGPLAVSSANVHGEPPATTVDAAYDQLGERVSVYLDAGPTPGPLPSTILDATGDTLRVLRQGVISLERLREVIPDIESDED
jgi:tRNA threonylcarbamoyl adenosine modification protein (Sua5/YciO/YrdC/YwlC family)